MRHGNAQDGDPVTQPRAPRLVDIAAHADVSLKTVSRVLNGEPNVSERMRTRVEQAASELGYVGDALARGLRLQRSGLLGLLIPDIRNRYYGQLVRAFEERIRARGYNFLLGDSDESPEQEDAYLTLFRQHRIDGLLVVSVGGRTLPAAVQQIPTVVVDRSELTQRLQADQVLSDDRESAELLTGHLIEKHGLSRICYVGGRPTSTSMRARQTGYRNTLIGAGLTPAVTEGYVTPADAEAGAYELFARTEPPFGVLATGAQMFWGAMAAISRLGLRLQEDVMLATFDSIGEAELTGVVPTQAVIPVDDMAEESMRLLDSRRLDPTRRPRKAIVACEISFGTTCGCVPLPRTPLSHRSDQ